MSEQFKDLRGDTWAFDLTFESVKRVKENEGVDLLYAIPKDKDDDNEPLVLRLDRDVLTMVNVWYWLLEPGLTAKDIGPAEFGSTRVGSKNYKEVADAFWAAYTLFFRELGWTQQVEYIQTMRKVGEDMLTKLEGKMGQVGEWILESFDADIEKREAEIRESLRVDPQ